MNIKYILPFLKGNSPDSLITKGQWSRNHQFRVLFITINMGHCTGMKKLFSCVLNPDSYHLTRDLRIKLILSNALSSMDERH